MKGPMGWSSVSIYPGWNFARGVTPGIRGWQFQPLMNRTLSVKIPAKHHMPSQSHAFFMTLIGKCLLVPLVLR